ncbi:MAG TPA: SgcJ/EcaC family oxidoreductase [Candidatus Polarisedimenticolaceae bacterium]|nr:SgcJ/EcaC family oxidoreductase [Candidatus Polarisedimenticolaceae bacterium]
MLLTAAALLAGLLAAPGTVRPAPAPPPSSIRKDIEKLLDTQSAAWSKGDLDGFCSVYVDDAAFITPSGLTQTKKAVLDRYRVKYKDPAGMGKLRLDVIEVRELTPDAASVVAQWTLTWPDKPEATGLTLLVLKKTKEGWRILQDASM